MKLAPIIAAVALAASLQSHAATRLQAAAVDPPAYKSAAPLALGAGERWDYATYDAHDHRAYVAHGDHVTVIDTRTGKLAGEIGTFAGGTHGVAIARDAGIGYTDDGKTGEAIAFDLKTLKVLKHLKAEEDADGIVYDEKSKHVFVINGDSGTVTVIDPNKNDVLTTIKIGAGLEAGEVDNKGKLYIDGVAMHDIIVVDTTTNAVAAHYPMDGCERPHGIAVDAAARRVFATCINKLMFVVDADNGKVVAKLPIGGGSDGAAFDPVHKRVVSSNGEGTLSVYEEKDADHYVSRGEVQTARSARTITIDASNGTLYLPAADIAKVEPPATAGGRPRTTYAPGSMKLLVLTPQ